MQVVSIFGNVPLMSGTFRSEEVQADDSMRDLQDDFLDVATGQVATPNAPHEFPVGGGHAADGLPDITECDMPLVSRRVVAVLVGGREGQATDGNRSSLGA